MRQPSAVGLLAILVFTGCSHDSPGTTAATASASATAVASSVASSSSPSANDGTDAKSPLLSPADVGFVDARNGFGWGDRCFTEYKAGKFGWASAACGAGLALPNLDPAARPPLLFNQGLIAKQAGDLATARADFTQSLALRPAGDPGRATVEKELQAVGGTAPPASAVTGALECRAKNGTQTVELFLDWKMNMAAGSLRTTSATGVIDTKPVVAELYKGLILVNPAGAPGPNNRIATVQTDPQKTVQLGDYKQPWLPCQ